MKKLFALCVVNIILFGCNHSHDDGHGHDHGEAEESELEALAYTLYSDKTELFVEFKPLVVGAETRFAAHFTMLGDVFLPVTEGNVTLTLTGPGGEQKIVADQPSNPGIFRLELTPEKTGTYKLIFGINTKQYSDTIMIDSVTVYADEQSAIAAQEPESPSANEITYLKEQAWKIEFANEEIHKQQFSEVIRTSGQIVSAPGDERMIVATTTGIVLFGNSGIATGAAVNPGESLFIISGGALTGNNIDARFREAKTNLENAEAEFNRGKELAKTNIISQQELLRLETNYKNATTAFGLVAKDYSSGGQRVSSPINGFLKSILVSQGQYVTEGQPIALVSQNQRLQLKVDVPSARFDRLPLVMSANFILAGSNRLFSTTNLNGKVISYSKSIEGNSPFVSVTFEVDNAAGIIPGAYCDVFLKTSSSQQSLAVPVNAIIEEQDHHYVYVQTAGESFEKREVETGSSDGEKTQVLSGIAEGERVVTKGAFQVKLATMSGVMPAHGHEH